MNLNTFSIVPNCFKDYLEYSEWLYLARIAKESCILCEDCTADYKAKMKTQSRCQEEWHSVNILFPRSKSKGNHK